MSQEKNKEQLEIEIRLHVRELKKFYTNLVVYIAIFILCLIIWLITGAGSFWPIWVMLAFGAASVLQAVRLRQLPLLEEYLTFLRSDWEEQQIKELLKKAPSKSTNLD